MRRLILPLILLAVLAVVGVRLYEELSPAGSTANGATGFIPRPALVVDVAEAQPHPFVSNLEALGELAPLASVEVMSKVSGRLKELTVERGDAVQKGQLLAVVDDEDLIQQIRRAEASISVAKAAVSREEANVENLSIQARRYEQLHSESLISNQDLEDVTSRLRASRAQLELVRAQVEQADAALRELRVQQEQTRVYSPMAGFVGMRHLDPGALVSPSVPIVRVIDVSTVKTVVPVPETDLPLVRVGLEARVTVDAYPDTRFRARITRISPFLNPETRAADIEIEILNDGGALKPGMFARVTVETRASRTSLAIPRAALLTRGSQKGVYLLSDELETHFRVIEIGRIQDDFVEVLEGLEPGTRIVSSGAQQLNEGDKVKIG